MFYKNVSEVFSMKKYKNSDLGSWKMITYGFFIMLIVFLVLSLIVSLILFIGNNPTGNIGLISLAVFLFSGILSSFINSKLFKNSFYPLLSSALSVALFFAIAILMGGKISLKIVLNLVCFLLTSLLGAFLGGIKKETKHKKRRYQ